MGIACAPGYHRHDPQPVGGRCAFPDARKPSGLCGRDPVALYVNPFAKVLNTYRCALHDRPIVHEAAAAQGFRRVALESKSDRIAAVERSVAA
jgi:hypothetical protein